MCLYIQVTQARRRAFFFLGGGGGEGSVRSNETDQRGLHGHAPPRNFEN